MTVTKCDRCKLQIDGEIHKLSVEPREGVFKDTLDLCDVCLTELKEFLGVVI